MGVVMFQFITMIAYSKARCGGVLGVKRFASNGTRLVLRVVTLDSGCSMRCLDFDISTMSFKPLSNPSAPHLCFPHSPGGM